MYILDTNLVHQTNASLRMFSIYQVCAADVAGVAYSLQRCLKLDVDGDVPVVPDAISKAHAIVLTNIIITEQVVWRC